MNAPHPVLREATRHLVTYEELHALCDQGFFENRSRVVLLDGEIHIMADDGYRHINWTMALMQRLVRALPKDRYFIGVQTTLRLSRHNAPSPDIYVLDGRLPDGEVPAAKILLVVQVADTSLQADLTDSAARYARHGVREFWVLDAKARALVIHRGPHDGAYAEVRRIAETDEVAPTLIPDLTLRLSDLGA